MKYIKRLQIKWENDLSFSQHWIQWPPHTRSRNRSPSRGVPTDPNLWTRRHSHCVRHTMYVCSALVNYSWVTFMLSRCPFAHVHSDPIPIPRWYLVTTHVSSLLIWTSKFTHAYIRHMAHQRITELEQSIPSTCALTPYCHTHLEPRCMSSWMCKPTAPVLQSTPIMMPFFEVTCQLAGMRMIREVRYEVLRGWVWVMQACTHDFEDSVAHMHRWYFEKWWSYLVSETTIYSRLLTPSPWVVSINLSIDRTHTN